MSDPSQGSLAPFLKGSGAGNDFLLFELPIKPQAIPINWVELACDRHRGVGADGILLCGPLDEESDFWLRIFNRDGTEAAMCGNGLRCAVHYWAHSRTLLPDRFVRAHLPTSVHRGCLTDAGEPKIELQTPKFCHSTVIDWADRKFRGYLCDPGVPHFVVPIEGISPTCPRLEEIPLATWAPGLRWHCDWSNLGYPQGVNVTFVAVGPRGAFYVRTFERGIEGETLACGTGAAATAWAVGDLRGGALESEVVFASGQRAQLQRVNRPQGDVELWQTGPTSWPFIGKLPAPFFAAELPRCERLIALPLE